MWSGHTSDTAPKEDLAHGNTWRNIFVCFNFWFWWMETATVLRWRGGTKSDLSSLARNDVQTRKRKCFRWVNQCQVRGKPTLLIGYSFLENTTWFATLWISICPRFTETTSIPRPERLWSAQTAWATVCQWAIPLLHHPIHFQYISWQSFGRETDWCALMSNKMSAANRSTSW